MRLDELRGPQDEALSYEAWRLRLACLLMGLSAVLTRAAVAIGGLRRKRQPALEFYAEAGAPEGALYADGDRVATLPGVTRL
ncbi:MAG: hypothetical protein JO006_18535 [Paucibacter sp.]|nr:hypothetical protein [Roseateles sp.]